VAASTAVNGWPAWRHVEPACDDLRKSVVFAVVGESYNRTPSASCLDGDTLTFRVNPAALRQRFNQYNRGLGRIAKQVQKNHLNQLAARPTYP
jgi:hypothetical protein